MIMESPLFSIITITYNASSTIERTMHSVASQTCRDFEHIIVDGASRDNTLDIVNRFTDVSNISVCSEPDDGLYDAMNKGRDRAQGQYILFLNAGDKFHSENTLEQYKKAIVENDYPGIVYGQTILVDDNGNFVAPRHLSAPPKLKYKDFAQGMLVCHQAFMALKRLTPPFNLKYRFSADYDWCIGCLMHSRKNTYIDDVTIDYLYEGMTTRNRRASLIERFKIMSHYYGFIPTVWRHLGFISRFKKHQKQVKNGISHI